MLNRRPTRITRPVTGGYSPPSQRATMSLTMLICYRRVAHRAADQARYADPKVSATARSRSSRRLRLRRARAGGTVGRSRGRAWHLLEDGGARQASSGLRQPAGATGMGCKRRLGGSVLCMLITSCVLGCPDQGPHECTGQPFRVCRGSLTADLTVRQMALPSRTRFGRMSYRVIQWSTGNVGVQALHGIITHPDLELVGLWVHSDAKAGRDAGELCGLPATGVAATNDVDTVLALDADCVCYTATADLRPWEAVKDICRASLASGKNVVSSSLVQLLHPKTSDPAMVERLEAGVLSGGTTLLTSGIVPGSPTTCSRSC